MFEKRHTTASLAYLFFALLILAGCNAADSGSDPIASFSSGDIAPNETYSYTFEQEETVQYYCEIHAPDMQGEITVSADAEATDRDTVAMMNQQFQPSNLTVAPNTEVIWINNENTTHTVKSGNPSNDDDGGYY